MWHPGYRVCKHAKELAKETQFDGVAASTERGGGHRRTIVVVSLEGPGLPVAAVQEHLHAAPHQVLPAWPHGGVEGALLLDLNQLACEPQETYVKRAIDSVSTETKYFSEECGVFQQKKKHVKIVKSSLKYVQVQTE